MHMIIIADVKKMIDERLAFSIDVEIGDKGVYAHESNMFFAYQNTKNFTMNVNKESILIPISSLLVQVNKFNNITNWSVLNKSASTIPVINIFANNYLTYDIFSISRVYGKTIESSNIYATFILQDMYLIVPIMLKVIKNNNWFAIKGVNMPTKSIDIMCMAKVNDIDKNGVVIKSTNMLVIFAINLDRTICSIIRYKFDFTKCQNEAIHLLEMPCSFIDAITVLYDYNTQMMKIQIINDTKLGELISTIKLEKNGK